MPGATQGRGPAGGARDRGDGREPYGLLSVPPVTPAGLGRPSASSGQAREREGGYLRRGVGRARGWRGWEGPKVPI